ncbi:tRNA (adenosine(37)-N6)-dimethylallyltransferase MiaA [Candidatus Oleimmundimicrobium sp.]|uniref:tRNA (adenosine(37)-N6)-dimethylallyltransferase MiaA n=1 Tax=Candidatus Oleimmundimicrobium sp. TaxID=3060597 RepID=UPI00271B6981|nr:tRNA (adenosine(37)-N6)-dimethylallyltransferase MiaA [Candidatus Oleimmundimicrobium sp.]MDO8885407.1 tRNA (adenosine(37)-N6)-dimethylallyltransferase MiaA [Candidatus Oleimmundimicrobium sp.]
MKIDETIKEKVLVIVGPTAVGKSKIAIELAKKHNGEIISADSMQVYKGMSIGTAKLSSDEMQGVKHHLIDVAEPTENFSVAEYQKLARKAIFSILQRDKLPILVGGSGLYIKAVIDELGFPKGTLKSTFRQDIEKQAKDDPKSLHKQLSKLDPSAAKKIHPNNIRRLIRALEIVNITGKSYADYHKNWEKESSLYNVKIFGLNLNREKLYAKIDKRVEQMFKNGLVEEVEKLVSSGKLKSTTALQALGYKEIIRYLNGQIVLDEAKELIKQRTKNFAKRQLTWFKRDKRIKWIDTDGKEQSLIVNEIIDNLDFGRKSE